MNPSTADVQGKVCLITGATSGIGTVTARAGRPGANVVIVGRSPERCAATLRQIQAETGNPAVTTLRADLSSQQQVRNWPGNSASGTTVSTCW